MSNELPVGLPRYAVLRNRYSNQYLRYTHENTQQHSLLQSTATYPDSPYVKFEFEPSTLYRGTVHIKCCYNNKYLRRWNSSSNWIAAAADSVRDLQSWDCTLFRPSPTGNNFMRFRHFQLNVNVVLFSGAAPYDNFLLASSSTSLVRQDFDVVDWESLVFLPKEVALKGDNGRYLSADSDGNRDNYMSFSSNDLFGSRARLRPMLNPNGSLLIATNVVYPSWHYMRLAPNSQWIIWGRPGAGPIVNDRNFVFWPERLRGNKIALRNLGNNLYCRRNTRVVRRDRMEASEGNTPWEAQFEVEERVVSRRIHEVDFRLQDARIYNPTPRTLARKTVENNSPHLNESEIRLEYEDRTSRNWQATVSMTYGVKTTLTTGVPVIAEASVEVSWETTTEYTWGETHEFSQTVGVAYRPKVSPYSKMTVTMLGTEAACDVPFSYTQTDTLRDGTEDSTRKHDGIFTGVNSYDFRFENWEEKLPGAVIPIASV